MIGSMAALSDDLDRPDIRPYFLWDVEVTVAELRQRLADPDPATRSLWMARVLREARYPDVWKLVDVVEVNRCYPLIRPHLGRSRRFWDFLLEGWRSDGLLAA
jgi:hypothetical protein